MSNYNNQVFDKSNLPKCIKGFEHINRYYDTLNSVFVAKLLPGEFYVTHHDEMISTVLGSCVSACIRDPVAGVAGVNHFMLPIDKRPKKSGKSLENDRATRYGDFAMELLVNALLKEGGKRANLEVKLFGGSQVLTEMIKINVGYENINFIHNYVKTEQLNLLAEDLGDSYPRKINYFTKTGKVMVKKLRANQHLDITAAEDLYYTQILATDEKSSKKELFD